MMIEYTKGDVCKAQQVSVYSKGIIIPHIVNDLGVMGAGVALALAKKWPFILQEYEEWAEKEEYIPQSAKLYVFETGLFDLGETQFVQYSNITIANMIGQRGLISKSNPKPIQYDALSKCLDDVLSLASELNYEIHAPKFGSLRSGGDWNIIEEMVNSKLEKYPNIKFVVYEF